MELGTAIHGDDREYLPAALWEFPGPPNGNTHGVCACGLYAISFSPINDYLASGGEEMLAEWTFNPRRRGES
jgi:hypothetical protein